MRALILPLMGASASMACGFAAIGLATYAPQHGSSAAALYGAFGALAGLVCAVIDRAWRQLPTVARRDAEDTAGPVAQSAATASGPADAGRA